jgi:hypothetical protein
MKNKGAGGLVGLMSGDALSHILVQDTLEYHAVDCKDRSLNYPEYESAFHSAQLDDRRSTVSADG